MEIKLTTEQLRGFAKEIEESSKEEFLINRKAIKIRDGIWSIMNYDGLKLSLTDALPGYQYENDIPYTFWSEVLNQVDRFVFRREMAEKARLEALAEQQ